MPYGDSLRPATSVGVQPTTVVCTCFGPTLRVANAFGVVRTAHALPDLAHLRKEPYGLPVPNENSQPKGFFPQRGRKLAGVA